MRSLSLARSGATVAEQVRVADTWASRLVGLLGTPALAPGDGLLLVPCNAVHMLGMRYAIDVAYLDRRGVVVGLTHQLRPWRVGWPVRGARAVLELSAGRLAEVGVQAGDQLLGLPPL